MFRYDPQTTALPPPGESRLALKANFVMRLFLRPLRLGDFAGNNPVRIVSLVTTLP